MIVYLTKNKINGKKYVGADKNNDDQYFGSGIALKNAIRKYGYENFEKVVLERCENEDELYKAEQKWIEKFEADQSDDFYNIAKGGNGGNTRSGYSESEMKEYLQKQSEAQKGKHNYWKDKKRPEHSEKMKGRVPWNKGITMSESFREKMRKIRLNSDFELNEKQRKKIAESKYVPVVKYDLDGNKIKEYKSIKHAAEDTGCNRDSISGCVTGRYNTGAGFKWKYKKNV